MAIPGRSIVRRTESDSVGAIQDLLVRLRSRFGAAAAVLQVDDESMSLRLGRNEDAILGIRIADPDRPSFRVSYPALKTKRGGRGRDHVHLAGVDGVLAEGVEWIADQLLQHGVVKPEL